MPQAKPITQRERDLKEQLTGRVLRYTRAAQRRGVWHNARTFLYVQEVNLVQQHLVMLRVPPQTNGSFVLPRNGKRAQLQTVHLPLRLLDVTRPTTLAERAGDCDGQQAQTKALARSAASY